MGARPPFVGGHAFLSLQNRKHYQIFWFGHAWKFFLPKNSRSLHVAVPRTRADGLSRKKKHPQFFDSGKAPRHLCARPRFLRDLDKSRRRAMLFVPRPYQPTRFDLRSEERRVGK